MLVPDVRIWELHQPPYDPSSESNQVNARLSSSGIEREVEQSDLAITVVVLAMNKSTYNALLLRLPIPKILVSIPMLSQFATHDCGSCMAKNPLHLIFCNRRMDQRLIDPGAFLLGTPKDMGFACWRTGCLCRSL